MPLPDDIQRAVSAVENRDGGDDTVPGENITNPQTPAPSVDLQGSSAQGDSSTPPASGDLQAEPTYISREEHLQAKAENDRLKRELKESRAGFSVDEFKNAWKENPIDAARKLGITTADEDIENAFLNRYAPSEEPPDDNAPMTRAEMRQYLDDYLKPQKQAIEQLSANQVARQTDQEKHKVYRFVKDNADKYPALNVLDDPAWTDWALQRAYEWHNKNEISNWDDALPRLEKMKRAELERSAKLYAKLSGRSIAPTEDYQAAPDEAPQIGGDTPTPRPVTDKDRMERAIKAAQDSMRRRAEKIIK